MTKYHPIGMKVNPKKILNLSNREVELIKMMRKVEGEDYYSVIQKMWNQYFQEMETLRIETGFISNKRLEDASLKSMKPNDSLCVELEQ